MYFRIVLEPKTQFFTAVIGVDTHPYFLLRDVRNVLAIRNKDTFSKPRLDRLSSPLLHVRDVLPRSKEYVFKYERYFAVSEDTFRRIMDAYVSELDPELYQWFLNVWYAKGVKLVEYEKFLHTLDQPYVSAFTEKMPRFVVDASTNEGGTVELLWTDFFPRMVDATLKYYRDLANHQRLMSVASGGPAASMGQDALGGEESTAADVPVEGYFEREQQQPKVSERVNDESGGPLEGLFSNGRETAASRDDSPVIARRRSFASSSPQRPTTPSRTRGNNVQFGYSVSPSATAAASVLQSERNLQRYVVVAGELDGERTFLGYHVDFPETLVAINKFRSVRYKPVVEAEEHPASSNDGASGDSCDQVIKEEETETPMEIKFED